MDGHKSKKNKDEKIADLIKKYREKLVMLEAKNESPYIDGKIAMTMSIILDLEVLLNSK